MKSTNPSFKKEIVQNGLTYVFQTNVYKEGVKQCSGGIVEYRGMDEHKKEVLITYSQAILGPASVSDPRMIGIYQRKAKRQLISSFSRAEI